MKLTTRLLCFFLGAIAVVLLAFDGALYGLASVHLQRQVDERVNGALATLSAAVEIHADTVEWEPDERTIRMGPESGPDRVSWTVRDLTGKVVDCSTDFGGDKEAAGQFAAAEGETTHWQREPWRIVECTLLPSHKPGAAPDANAADAAKQFAGLRLTVGSSLAPVHDNLRTLGIGLVALSIGVWLGAALVGRRLCRRALAPVLRMTAEAEQITPDDLDRRLPLPGTGDEVEQLAQSFNGLLTRVQEAYERQRRFTGDASHQLRTPLTVMLGQVEVALRRERSREDYVRTLDVVRRRIIDLQQITEMLLFLARADAEMRISGNSTVEARELLVEAVERWQMHPRRGDLRIEESPLTPNLSTTRGERSDGPLTRDPSPSRGDGGDARLWVRVHRPLFAQLLDNIIDNALKYSPPGTPVLLRAGRAADGIRIAVEDRGPGIPAEELPQVFAPFFRGRDARTRGKHGVGLGLAVAQRIAAALGATINVDPGTDSGACFVIALPAAPAAEPSLENASDEKVSPACAQ